MARKAQNGEVNKSAAIRDLLEQNPSIKAKEVVTTLGERGVKVAPGLVYFIKGKMKGKRGRRKQLQGQETRVATGGLATSDPLATIRKVKALASEVGGLKKLAALVEALSA